MEKRTALFEVKALGDDNPDGEFEAVLSVPVIDRDGEVITAGAFNPLPAEIPIHKFHDFSSPVATAVPFYDGDVLKARGVFDPDPESQAIRSKIGRSIRYMSVGFMAPSREDRDGVPHITKAELLEASFVSIPSNREAAILAVKAASLPSGTLQVTVDGNMISSERFRELVHRGLLTRSEIRDLMAARDEAGAAGPKSPATDPEEKAATPAAAEPPADVIVGQALIALARARAALLST